MAASQEQRIALYDKIRDEWGERYALAFIEIVPPMDADQIATEQDVENATILLRGEMAELRGELLFEMGKLRSEFGDLRGEFGDLRGEFRAHARNTTITMLTGLVTIWLTVVVPHLL